MADVCPSKQGMPEKLATAQASEYWRSLQEWSGSPEFEELLHREFPRWAAIWDDVASRREFLKVMAASLALAGLGGCTQAPRETIVPYVRQPVEVTPGRPLYYATAMPMAGYANGGLLVQSRLGRPIKVEGNPSHPWSAIPPETPEHGKFGPADIFAQASPLALYDPDRSRSVLNVGEIRSWEAFVRTLRARLSDLGEGGEGLCILTETVTSPTLAAQLENLQRTYPAARWYVHDPVSRENIRAGTQLAFGQRLEPVYDFTQADVVLALDSDFLTTGPGSLRYARDFMSRRRAELAGRRDMNRLYVVESTPSPTGAKADHRLPLRSSQVESFARALARQLGVQGDLPSAGPDHAVRPEWIQALTADLTRRRGRSVVLAGINQPPAVHALAHAMNQALGNTATVRYLPPADVRPPQAETGLTDLVRRLQRDEVRLLLLVGGNPVYTAPGDLDFAQALARARLAAHLSLYQDETSAHCHWHIPAAHYLESWGDVRAIDGGVSLMQPLIAPLYGGKTPIDFLGALSASGESSAYGILRAHWRQRGLSWTEGFDQAWQRALHDGFVRGTENQPAAAALNENWQQRLQGDDRQAAAASASQIELVIRPDPTIYDGNFANNGWLQELPKPLSKVTWDNAAYMSPATAVRLGLATAIEQADQANGREIELEHDGRRVRAAAWTLPAHADDAVTVHLGYGRTRVGRVGNGVGFDAYRLRGSAAPWIVPAATLRVFGGRLPIATTQHHHLMYNRDLVREGQVQSPPEIPRAAQTPRSLISLYPERPQEGNQWGMAIDLTACIGCNACVVACQSENNIPVVGKTEVMRGREMHWIRVDSYYKGPPAEPLTFFQPVPCMHCENAPCEVVCPVMATVHSTDGLNDMVYNRCVGTRYCSNNCPYKVRRFNFFQYADFESETLRLLHNPEVTVRSRGVMEKCTYCVQRIRTTQIDAQREDRAIRDGEVMTACQSACPTRAIVFGDLGDRNSKVHALQNNDLNYGLLYDLNTRPRTTYLAALRNPNLDIPAEWRVSS